MTEPHDRYTAVIFTNQHSGIDIDEYQAETAHMEQLAATQPGFRNVESVRSGDGLGITVSYWDSARDARAWKENSEHLLAQRAGREL